MNLSYELVEGMCVTPCPHEQIWLGVIVCIGGTGCCRCAYYEGVDWDKKIVKCERISIII